jgi:hypothetical protein
MAANILKLAENTHLTRFYRLTKPNVIQFLCVSYLFADRILAILGSPEKTHPSSESGDLICQLFLLWVVELEILAIARPFHFTGLLLWIWSSIP